MSQRTGRGNAGFTLIEILVVIVIIAVLTGVVTLNLNIRNVSKSVQDEARRIGALMQFASDQAIYSRQQLGIRFHPESYEFYILAAVEESEDLTWQIIDDDRLAMRTPPEPMLFEMDIEGLPIVLETLADERKTVTDEEPVKPHILFLSNGEIMPDFRVLVSDTEGDYQHQIYSGEEEPVVVEVVE
ncbi:MAG: type II secretion system minor pseudopilin GspH [Gammaproteobacteria bacterium]|nr:type II secretion system minor pseudopilin GspH [Gammaproteobacteria bacterium]